MKIKVNMKIWERVNPTGELDKQMRIRKEVNITKITSQ
jgi:hypothetical protein